MQILYVKIIFVVLILFAVIIHGIRGVLVMHLMYVMETVLILLMIIIGGGGILTGIGTGTIIGGVGILPILQHQRMYT